MSNTPRTVKQQARALAKAEGISYTEARRRILADHDHWVRAVARDQDIVIDKKAEWIEVVGPLVARGAPEASLEFDEVHVLRPDPAVQERLRELARLARRRPFDARSTLERHVDDALATGARVIVLAPGREHAASTVAELEAASRAPLALAMKAAGSQRLRYLRAEDEIDRALRELDDQLDQSLSEDAHTSSEERAHVVVIVDDGAQVRMRPEWARVMARLALEGRRARIAMVVEM